MQVPCGFSLALSGCGEDRATTINLETRDFAIETSNSTPASMESVRLGLVAIDAQGNRSDAALLDDITRVEWGLRRRNPANDRCGLSAFRHQYAAEGTIRLPCASRSPRVKPAPTPPSFRLPGAVSATKWSNTTATRFGSWLTGDVTMTWPGRGFRRTPWRPFSVAWSWGAWTSSRPMCGQRRTDGWSSATTTRPSTLPTAADSSRT